VKREWRCTQCGKLLGMVQDARLHIQFARGHTYIVGFPAASVCRGCGTLNELMGPQEGGQSIARSETAVRS